MMEIIDFVKKRREKNRTVDDLLAEQLGCELSMVELVKLHEYNIITLRKISKADGGVTQRLVLNITVMYLKLLAEIIVCGDKKGIPLNILRVTQYLRKCVDKEKVNHLENRANKIFD
jgi:hypothetical protein